MNYEYSLTINSEEMHVLMTMLGQMTAQVDYLPAPRRTITDEEALFLDALESLTAKVSVSLGLAEEHLKGIKIKARREWMKQKNRT